MYSCSKCNKICFNRFALAAHQKHYHRKNFEELKRVKLPVIRELIDKGLVACEMSKYIECSGWITSKLIIFLDEEYKKKLRNNIAKRKILSLERNKEKINKSRRERFALGILKPTYGMLGKHHTEETKSKISKAITESYNINPSLRLQRSLYMIDFLDRLWGDSTSREEQIIAIMNGKNADSRKESKIHVLLKLKLKQILVSKGYTEIKTEYPILIGERWYLVDVVGLDRNKKSVAIECGYCKKEKLKDLKQVFDLVLHIPFDLSKKILNIKVDKIKVDKKC